MSRIYEKIAFVKTWRGPNGIIIIWFHLMMMKILRMLMKILRIMKLSKTQRGNVNKSTYFVFFKLTNPNT